MLNIVEKIEEIREQPQQIRLRWVWGSVFFSMLIIFAIWILSITMMFNKDKSVSSQIQSTLLIDKTDTKSTSLKDYAENNSLTIGDEGVSRSQNQKNNPTDFDAQKSNNASDVAAPVPAENINQSNAYSNLGNSGQ